MSADKPDSVNPPIVRIVFVAVGIYGARVHRSRPFVTGVDLDGDVGAAYAATERFGIDQLTNGTWHSFRIEKSWQTLDTGPH